MSARAWLCVWALVSAAVQVRAAANAISGTVSDPSGLPVVDARVAVLDGKGGVVRELRSGAGGGFLIGDLEAGRYAVLVEASGFNAKQVALDLTGEGLPRLRVRLDLAAVATAITVTATRGSVEDVDTSPYLVHVTAREDFLRQPLVTLGAALQNKPGVLAQATTFGQVSPFLRGLTGYQTLILLDGVRFNTSFFRSGPNQYLSFVDAFEAERVEVTLGPSSAAYGSDSLGGTIHVLTDQPRFGSLRRLAVHGEMGAYTGSADASGTGRARIAVSNANFWWSLGGSAARHNDLRAGGGIDSRNVFRRYFGLDTEQIRSLLGGRLQDTAFTEHGVSTKLAFRPGREQTLTGWYQRTGMDGLRSYRDLLGGLGRLQSLFDPQFGQLGYIRYEKLRTGPLDSLSGTFSVNSQADGAIRQGTRTTDVVAREDSRVRALGYSVQGTTHAGLRHAQVFGAELYSERVEASRFEDNPVTLARVQTRALFPNGARYRTAAAFLQNMSEIVPGKLRATAGVRFTSVRFRSLSSDNLDRTGASLGVADSTQNFRDVTFHTSATYRATQHIALHAIAGRGFRAPNVSDLGRIGLNGGLGYEIPADQAARYGAWMGDTSGEGALWTGKTVGRLSAETLDSYEAGITLHADRVQARVQVFDAELSNPIVGRTVLFPADGVPQSIAGLAVVMIAPTAQQKAQGVVTVAPVGIDPRSLKTVVNDGRSKYYGVESNFRYALSARWAVHANYSWMNGRDLYPNRPARRLPPQQGSVSLWHTPSGRRPWFVWSAAFAGPQGRMSAGDFDDERIGASRRRADITSFFNSAIVAAYLERRNSSLVFAPTGETLAQIRDRVLPIGSTINGVRILDDNTRVPMFLRTAGWIVTGVHGGIPLGETWSLNFGVQNLLDRNYRVHGSGIDANGIHAFAGMEYRF